MGNRRNWLEIRNARLPFGYSFEITTHMSAVLVRDRIRARTKRWLDAKTGARGWIVGPVICLWLTTLDPRGPMLLGWIASKGSGAVIRGRAGSDLNGLLMLALVTGLVCASIIQSPPSDSIFGVVLMVLVFSVVVLLLHKQREKAAPLVRFLEDALSESGEAVRQMKPGSFRIGRPLTLNVNGEDRKGVVSSAAIYDTLTAMIEDDFLILSSTEETFMQVMSVGGDFSIERRDGDQAHHFIAHRQGGSVSKQPAVFSFNDTLAVIGTYVTDEPTPTFIRWERLYA